MLAFGDVAVDEAVQRVTPLISRDNDEWIEVIAPFLLETTEVLHALGLSSDPMAATLLTEIDGERREISISAGREPSSLSHGGGMRRPGLETWRHAGSEDLPLPRRHRDRHYWFDVLEGDVLYVTLGHCCGRYDMRPIQDVAEVVRGSWENPTYLELLRRALRWARRAL